MTASANRVIRVLEHCSREGTTLLQALLWDSREGGQLMSQPLRVLIVQQHLAHYRRGVFMELDKSAAIEATFAADVSDKDGNIPAIPMATFKRALRLRNMWLGSLLWQRGLLDRIARGRFDCVIFTGDVHHISTWVALLLARLRGVRSYLWTTGWHRPDSRFKGLVRTRFYRLADHVLLYGEDGYNIARSVGLPASKMTIIGNSVTPQAPTPPSPGVESIDVDSLLPAPAEMHLVGAVVRVNPAKRLDLLIEATARLRARGAKIGVLLTDGPAGDSLRRQAAELGVPLFMVGAVYDEETLSKIYERLEVTVVPELAGLTVMQSLSHGTPVVTNDDPNRQASEFRAVRHGITGLLYTAGDIDSLATAIEGCLAMVDERGAELEEACKAEIDRNWSVDVHASRILAALTANSMRESRSARKHLRRDSNRERGAR